MTISLAEQDDHPMYEVGDMILLGRGRAAVITQEGLDCDCGKGALCPLNPQFRVAGVTKVK